jgi:hypothetical protein
MKRTGMKNVGIGSLMCGVALLAAPAAPAMADGFSIGGLFASGKHGGTVIGGFLRISAPRPAVVAAPVVVTRPVIAPAPVIVERVWVSTPRTECRQVPVIDAWGRVIAYRQECVTIPDGHWETITRPTPVACATAVVVHHNEPVRVHEDRHDDRERHGANDSHRYSAPPPGRVPTAPSFLRTALPAR